jgi:hypothetical protein
MFQNPVFVSPLPRDLSDLKARIIAALKNIECGNNLNIISMCAVSPVVHTSNISTCQKKHFQFSCGCEQFHYSRSFGLLVINVCNRGQHYGTPCISCLYLFRICGPGSSVGIATDYGLGGPGIEFRDFLHLSRPALGGPPRLLYNGYRDFPGGKAAGAWRWPLTPF